MVHGGHAAGPDLSSPMPQSKSRDTFFSRRRRETGKQTDRGREIFSNVASTSTETMLKVIKDEGAQDEGAQDGHLDLHYTAAVSSEIR